MIHRRYWWALLALSMGFLFNASLGCSTVEERPGNPQLLEETARNFHTNYRWARFEHASDAVHENYRQTFLGRYEELGEDFRVVDMTFKSVEIVDDGFAAILEIDQEWYQLPDTSVTSERFVERWVYEDGNWWLRERMTRGEYRELGRVFPSEEKDEAHEDEVAEADDGE